MSDIARVYLPQVPVAYDQKFERGRNSRIEDLVKTRLAKDELPAYGGVPNAALTGTNAAFVINNAYAVVPFNTVAVTDPLLIVGSNLQPLYVMNILFNIEIHVVTTVSGTATLGITIYSGATSLSATDSSVEAINGENISRLALLANVPAGAILTMQMRCSKNLTIDLTNSAWWAIALSPNPKYNNSERL